MEKQRIFGKKLSLLLALTIISFALSGGACGQELTTSVLIQQTPAQGGMVAPAIGVHQFELNTDVKLTATPKPGYQFVYWIGDVSDPTTNATTAYLDSPKIIIAVFERAEYDFLAPSETSISRAGGGGLRASSRDYQRGGISPVAGRRRHKFFRPSPDEDDPEEDPDVPIPPEVDPELDFPIPDEPILNEPILDDNSEPDFPIPNEPIPEPATVLLLGLGGLVLVARKKTKKRNK